MIFEFRHLLVMVSLLALSGCFSSDKPLIEIGSSKYYAELEGSYLPVQGEIDESTKVEEGDALFHVVYSKEKRAYSCRSGNETLLTDVQKLADNLYLLQSTMQVPDDTGNDFSSSQYLALFKRTQAGHLVMVMPEEEEVAALMQDVDVVAEKAGDRVYELQGVEPRLFNKLMRKIIKSDLVPMKISYRKVPTA